MSFRAIQRIIQMALAVTLLSKMAVIPFSPLYMKYLNLSVFQMGMIRAIHTWLHLIFIPFWMAVASKITNNSFKRTGISGAAFATLAMCVCLSLVPPKHAPINITHCSANTFNHTLLAHSKYLNVNSNYNFHINVVSPTFQSVKSPKKNNNLEIKNIIKIDSQEEKKQSFLEDIQRNSKQQKTNLNKSIQFSNQGLDKDVEERKRHKISSKYQSNNEINIQGVFRNNASEENIFWPVNHNLQGYEKTGNKNHKSSNIPKDEKHIFPPEPKKVNNQDSRYIEIFYQDPRSTHRMQPLLINRNKRKLSNHKRVIENKKKKYLFKNKVDQMFREIESKRYTTLTRENYNNSKYSLTTPFPPIPMRNISWLTDESKITNYPGQNKQKPKTLLLFLEESFFFSEVFLTVLILTVFYEFFLSQAETWTEVFCAHFFDGESESRLDKIFSCRLRYLKSTLGSVFYPLLAFVTAKMPCPYEIAYHYLISSILLVVFLIIALFFLPLHNFLASKGFRSRKPSKPPAKAMNEQQGLTSQKVSFAVACIIVGTAKASCSEFILWHGADLPGFPLNYEYLFCGYLLMSNVGYILSAECLQRWQNRKGPIDEDSESEEEIIHYAHGVHIKSQSTFPRPWREEIMFMTSAGILSVILSVVPSLKAAWMILILSVLKGSSDALSEKLEVADSHHFTEFGYGFGCILGSVLSTVWNINDFFYSASILTLTCSVVWLLFR